MSKKEMLELIQINAETKVAIPTLQGDIRKGKLRATKIGRKYLVSREELNRYLGLGSNDELLEKDLEISKLRNQLEGYKRQYATIKQLMQTMEGVINVL